LGACLERSQDDVNAEVEYKIWSVEPRTLSHAVL